MSYSMQKKNYRDARLPKQFADHGVMGLEDCWVNVNDKRMKNNKKSPFDAEELKQRGWVQREAKSAYRKDS